MLFSTRNPPYKDESLRRILCHILLGIRLIPIKCVGNSLAHARNNIAHNIANEFTAKEDDRSFIYRFYINIWKMIELTDAKFIFVVNLFVGNDIIITWLFLV